MRMPHMFMITLLLGAMAANAGAQERYVPVIDAATKEYGISGLYSKRAVSDTANVSDFTISARYGYMIGMGFQFELETGYARHNADVPDSLATIWNLGGNALYNLSLLSPRFSVFGLLGYGYEKHKTSVTVGGSEVDSSTNTGYLQYGIGCKYMLAANSAIRLDYRWIKPSDDMIADRQALMIGVSILQ